MFPPQVCETHLEMFTNLWGSLHRAGSHFSNAVQIEDTKKGFVLSAQMTEMLPKEIKPVVATYMKQYAQASGWRLKVKLKKGYIELTASRAASKASKNV